ncbi:MAG TPA: hypothetical protein VE631_01225 [Alphaproteobacteria bacterium]|nr:hypothetical protein [Alphaproteobacteria bacterium]
MIAALAAGFWNVHRNTVPLLGEQLEVALTLIAANLDPTLPPPALSRRIDELAVRAGGVGFLLDEQNRLVAYPQIGSGLLAPGVKAAEHDAIIAAFLSPKARLERLAAPGMEGYLVEVRGDHYGVAVRRLSARPEWRLGLYLLRPSALLLASPLERLLLSALAAALTVALLIWALARSRLAPLREIARAAEGLAAPEPMAVASLYDRGGPELRRTAQAINRLRELVRIYDGLLPRDLARRLAAAPGLLKPRRAPVAVMASGLIDFTGLVGQLDDAAAVDLLRRHLSLLAGRIAASGGRLIEVSGDGIVALWGGLDAGETEAESAACALQAAGAIAALFAEENAGRRAEGQAPFRLCLGIAAGEAVIGDLGPVGQIALSALGRPIVLACKLQRACRSLPAVRGEVRCLATRAVLPAAGSTMGEPVSCPDVTVEEEIVALRL